MKDDVLKKIIANKKRELDVYKAIVTPKKLSEGLEDFDGPIYSLSEALKKSQTGIIAEFKRKSPSKGWINEKAVSFDVVRDYKLGGAAAVSVLTDSHFFGGSMEDLRNVASKIDIPALRKDFIIDEYQIIQARLLGASAILLIAAALTKREVNRLTNFASKLNLEVLLELHHMKELDYIKPEHKIIGINNRNLGTFETDIAKSFEMAEMLPKDTVWVAESGISHPQIVTELREVGYRGFLIGEHFMRSDNPGAELINFIYDIKVK